MKIYISAHAKQLRELEWSISEHADVIIEHILKLICMPNHNARNHWFGEIAGQLKRVKRLKSSGKYPSKDLIYEWTYTKSLDDFLDLSWIKQECKVLSSDYNIEITGNPKQISDKLDYVCKSYFAWLADVLSKNGVVSNAEIYSKLEELL